MGILIALIIMIMWGGHLSYTLFFYTPEFNSVYLYFHILLQMYLFTGLFITAHDAMHGNIARSSLVNKIFGYTAAALYAGLSYKRLIKNHFTHHRHPGTEKDPDYSNSSFFIWWFVFMKRYSTVLQFILMGIMYNLLKMLTDEINLLLLWILPAVLSTFQLFYFGTYAPHKTPHTHSMEPHKARSQKKNFILGLLSCYFFGFHSEHHNSPHTPWWRLYNIKD